jgi:hypothetical protein
MDILAIREPRSRASDGARELAQALGLSLVEARGRLHGEGARVVAVHADRARAEAGLAALESHGFDGLILGVEERKLDERETLVADGFELHPESFEVRTQRAGSLGLPYHAIRLLVRGLRIAHSAHTDTESKRVVSLGKALVTGGVMFTKKVQTSTTRLEEERTHFLRVFTVGRPPVDLPENELLYQGLGAAMQATRAANFATLVRELQDRAGNAAFDDRLATRAGQVQVLSERLPPEKFLEAAVSLIARARDAR